jgi:hypothetical protein
LIDQIHGGETSGARRHHNAAGSKIVEGRQRRSRAVLEDRSGKHGLWRPISPTDAVCCSDALATDWTLTKASSDAA